MYNSSPQEKIWNMNVGEGAVFADSFEKAIVNNHLDEYTARDITEYFCEVYDDRLPHMRMKTLKIWETKQCLSRDDDSSYTKDINYVDGWHIHYVMLDLTFEYEAEGTISTIRARGDIDLNKTLEGILKDIHSLRMGEQTISIKTSGDVSEKLLDRLDSVGIKVA